MDYKTLGLVCGVLVLLGAATAVVSILRRRTDSGVDPAIVQTFWLRVRAWWILCAVLGTALFLGPSVTILLFGLISFWALREFITLTPTRPGDHRALFWVFFLVTPLQFVLIGIASYSRAAVGRLDTYALYSILIPVYVFLFIPARIAMSGDSKRFLERTAKIQAGLLICVYCLSYAPALLTLPLSRPQNDASQEASANPGTEQAAAESSQAESPPAERGESLIGPSGESQDVGRNARLLFFFILIVQLSEALQYAWAQMPSKHVIVPTIHPTKTWEGLLGGAGSVTLIGAVLWWAIPPFPYWFAGAMSLVIAFMGFGGALTMSAIKRDRGVKDYGTLVEGHGGILDRIDSVCFAAPVFYHFTRYWLYFNGYL
jgi:phosphatidate cytidylyltransferase